MGCEQSNLSNNPKASQISNRGKAKSIYQEENKSKDPPVRPMSKMDTKTTLSTSTQASKLTGAPLQRRQTDIDRKDSVARPQEISLFSNLQEELENELSRREHSETESLVKKEDHEEPPYQITKEQHEEIYYFAKESCRLVHVYSQRLHEQLISSLEENSDLPLVMQYLKNSIKDVENCVDDLGAYPIQNEKKFYAELGQCRQVAKEIKAEYRKYEEKISDYSSFRETILNVIYKFIASVEGQKGDSKDTHAFPALTRNSQTNAKSNENEHDNKKKEEWVSSGLEIEKNDHDAVTSDKKTGVDTPSTQEEGMKSIGDLEALTKEKIAFEIKTEEHHEEKFEEIRPVENENVVVNVEIEAEKEVQSEEKVEITVAVEDVEQIGKPEIKSNEIENESDLLVVQGETEMRERRDSKGAV